MNYLTYFRRDWYPEGDSFSVIVATGPDTKPTADGGPWACEYQLPREQRHRLAEISKNAERILFQALRASAPEVYARCVALGWSPLSSSVADGGSNG